MKPIFDDTVFEKNVPKELENGEFNCCTFRDCDFTNLFLAGTELIDCTFISCNLSMVRFENTILNQVKFINCKIVGADFGKCSAFLFHVSFEQCILNYSIFQKNDLKNTLFKNCQLWEAGFMESNLTGARFQECDLNNAVFEKNNLEKADFISSINYAIKPESNRLKKTKFALPEVLGLLKHLDIEINS